MKENHNFLVPLVDTDAITVCYPDFKKFDKSEIESLTEEINSFGYKHIKWEYEFYMDTIIVVAAKNYILWDGQKLKIKGASLKASNKEFFLKDYINGVIKILLDPNYNNQQIVDLYNETAKKCLSVTDISQYSFKKTFTKAVQEGEGTMELKTRLALKYEVGVQQGDKFRVFYLPNSNLCLEKNFSGEYCKKTLLKKLYATTKIFKHIIPIELFTNYSLVNNYYPFSGESKPIKAKKVKNVEV